MNTLADQAAKTFDDLRSAVQEQRYDDVKNVLELQREIFSKMDFNNNPEELSALQQAQDLTSWALSLSQVQRSHTEQALTCMLRLKQLDEGYLPSAVSSAELIRVRG